jgi:N-methylhydantoinase B
MDRIHHAPKGYDGGLDGAKATVEFSTGEIVTQKGTRDLGAGTEIILNLPGGGGLGDPADRDPALIERDLRNQIVSAVGAERDYGVSVSADGSGSRLVSV